MPITIQEIIASDTISQLVDKTNFNFDQLMLNGGGPAGPIGPAGPVGPPGGRGPKGTTWYTGTVNPNTIIVSADLLVGDFYLEDSGVVPPPVTDGDVWEYNGTIWVVTTTNLEGPIGPAGQTGGFGEHFGIIAGPPENSFNTTYPSVLGGAGFGANVSNEGVQSVMVGGVIANTLPDAGFPFTSEYIILNGMAQSIQTTNTSLFIHNKNSSTTSIRFHGGQNATNSENYEQGSIGALSNISLQPDDMLRIDIPKGATTPGNNTDMIGFQVYAPLRGSNQFIGTRIRMESGVAGAPAGFGGYNANIEMVVGLGGLPAGNKFSVVTQGTSAAGTMELGTGVTLVNTPPLAVTSPGTYQLTGGTLQMTANQSSSINLIAGNTIKLDTKVGGQAGAQIQIVSNDGGIDIRSDGGGILVVQEDAAATNKSIVLRNDATSTTSGVEIRTTGGDIEIIQDNSGGVGNIEIRNDYTGVGVGGDIYIHNTSQIILKKAGVAATKKPSIVLDHQGTWPEHIRYVGFETWQGEDATSGSGQATLPPKVNRYFKTTYGNVESDPENTLTQYGNGGDGFGLGGWVTQLTAGAAYARYLTHRDALWEDSNVVIGKDLYTGEAPGAGGMGVSVEDFQALDAGAPTLNPHKQYVHLNDSNGGTEMYGLMSASPVAYNRTLKKGQNIATTSTAQVIGYDNYIDVYSATVPFQNDKGGSYGYATSTTDGWNSAFLSSNKTEVLKHPYVNLTFASSAGMGSSGNHTYNNPNYNYTFYFPLDPGIQVPGSRIEVCVSHLGSSLRYQTAMGGPLSNGYTYGTITMEVPSYRIKKLTDLTWGPWQNKQIPLIVYQGNTGQSGTRADWMNQFKGALIYDGASVTFRTGDDTAPSGNSTSWYCIQYGYTVEGSSSASTNLVNYGALI